MASQSFKERLWELLLPMFMPPLRWMARITVMRFVPIDEISSLMFCVELCPKLTMAMTDEMPMITPSMVSNERVLFLRIAS